MAGSGRRVMDAGRPTNGPARMMGIETRRAWPDVARGRGVRLKQS
jgi:hypothetical protein